MRLRKQLEEGGAGAGGGEDYDDDGTGSKDDDGETKRVVKEVVKIEHTGISRRNSKLREETERRGGTLETG